MQEGVLASRVFARDEDGDLVAKDVQNRPLGALTLGDNEWALHQAIIPIRELRRFLPKRVHAWKPIGQQIPSLLSCQGPPMDYPRAGSPKITPKGIDWRHG